MDVAAARPGRHVSPRIEIIRPEPARTASVTPVLRFTWRWDSYEPPGWVLRELLPAAPGERDVHRHPRLRRSPARLVPRWSGRGRQRDAAPPRNARRIARRWRAPAVRGVRL